MNAINIEKLFDQALEYHSTGEKEAAAETYRQILRVNCDHVGALVNLAVILKSQNHFDTAKLIFKSDGN